MSLFVHSSNVHSTDQALNSAINNLIHIPSFDTVTYGKNSIKFYCAQLWNNMFPSGFIQINADHRNDVHLTEINSIHYFKKLLKKHFLYKYSIDDKDDYIYYWSAYLVFFFSLLRQISMLFLFSSPWQGIQFLNTVLFYISNFELF